MHLMLNQLRNNLFECNNCPSAIPADRCNPLTRGSVTNKDEIKEINIIRSNNRDLTVREMLFSLIEWVTEQNRVCPCRHVCATVCLDLRFLCFIDRKITNVTTSSSVRTA